MDMSMQSTSGGVRSSREVEVEVTQVGSGTSRSNRPLLSVLAMAALGLLACGDESTDPNVDGINMVAGAGATPGAGAGPAQGAGTGVTSGTGGLSTSGNGAAGRATPSAGAGGSSAAGAGGASGAGTSGTGGAGAGGAGVGGPAGAGTGSAGTGGTPGAPSDADYAKYHDPGTGVWEMGTAAECKLETSRIAGGNNLAVIRYGKLCHIQGGNTSGQNFSATKTLGGVLGGRAAYLVKDVPRTGPGTGPMLHEDKVSDWGVSTSGINANALLSHVMAMNGYNSNLDYGRKSFSYDTVGTREITKIVDVAMVALKQAMPPAPTESGIFMQQHVFDKLGMKASTWAGGTIGTGWVGTLEDMARVGVMLVHDGWYGGERFMEASWVYRMSHPSHEDANTAYGQLAWLNNRGGGSSFGAEIDTCAPAAFWPDYPHVGSEAPDCSATTGGCEQEHDVGVFSAQGLGGQFIVMHPGLDLVIVAHNADAPRALWAAVRPAVVAMDPMFMGDDAAFCEAYGKGSYAPDLLVPRIAPTK